MGAFPPSMFSTTGEPYLCKLKSSIKDKLRVDVSENTTSKPYAIIIDGCALLWTLNWPSNGTVNDFIQNMKQYLSSRLKWCDVYFEFDRYYEQSRKQATRDSRQNASIH